MPHIVREESPRPHRPPGLTFRRTLSTVGSVSETYSHWPVGDIERALSDGELPERKAVTQAVVAEIRVRDRGQIQPVFRVPIFGPPYGLVPPAGIEPATRGLGNRCSLH
jgi:hypothetical protein